MPEAAERTEAWRQAKRDAGYRPVTLWLPRDVILELHTVADARRQDLSTCVTEAVRALAVSQGVRKPLKLDAHQYQLLKAELAADLGLRVGGEGALARPPVPAAVGPAAPSRRPRTGGKPSVAPAVLARIREERERYPNMAWKDFCQHLYETGVYRTKRRGTGEEVPVDYTVLYKWLRQAQTRTTPAGAATP